MRRLGLGLVFSALFFGIALFLTVDTLLEPQNTGGDVVQIPDLVGECLPDLSEDERFSLAVEYIESDAPKGTVLFQEPPAGSHRRCKEGERCTIRLRVSRGTEAVRLPSLLGLPAQEAAARLRSLGLRARIERCESPYPAGNVYRMQPEAGTVLPGQSEVLLTVSRGEAVSMVEVPALTGSDRADALVQLWLLHLRVGEVITLPSLRPSGEVLRQLPLAGERVAAGTRVTLYVSGGSP